MTDDAPAEPPSRADDDLTEARRIRAEALEVIANSRETRLGAAVLRLPRSLRKTRGLGSAARALRTAPTTARRPVVVATVTDRLTAAMLDGLFHVVELHALVWRQQIARARPDVLLVESAWLGRDRTWEYEVSRQYLRHGGPLPKLVQWCRRNGVPTVFWNKEDPVWFDRFLPAARQFDAIATTDEQAAGWYRAIVPDAQVVVAPFAINPARHHPVRDRELRSPDRVVFAGNFSNGKYPDREEALGELLERARRRDALDIYARTPEGFPRPFRTSIRGTLSPRAVADVSKRYAASLNVNSVGSSRTMVSRRVVEQLGCGVPVISSASPALEHLYPGCVFEVRSEQEIDEALDAVLDPHVRADRSALAWRVVHSRHRADDRFAEIFGRLGLDVPADDGGWDVVASPAGEAARLATGFSCAPRVLAARPGQPPGTGVHLTSAETPDDTTLARRVRTGSDEPSHHRLILDPDPPQWAGSSEH